MISDVLSDASDQIADYQKSMPDTYDGLSPEIEVVKLVMDSLRLYLDLAPGCGIDAEARAIRNEIGRLDLTSLTAARERFQIAVQKRREEKHV